MLAAKAPRMRLAILVVLALLAAPTAARAQAPAWGGPPGAEPYLPPPAPPLSPVAREVSYARQTLISDGIAVALVATAFLQDDPYSAVLLGASGINVYALGAPIVHFANRQLGNGLKSFGARIAGPYLGAMLGNLLGPKDHIVCKVGGDCPEPNESTIGIAIGAGVGALAAMAFDARYLAHKRVVEWVPPVAPSVGYTRSGFTLGLTGAF